MAGSVNNDPWRNLLQSKGAVLRIIAAIFAIIVLAVSQLRVSGSLRLFLEEQRDPRSWLANELTAMTLPELLFYSGGFASVAAVLSYVLPILIVAAIAMSVIPAVISYVRLVDLLALCVSALILLGAVIAFFDASSHFRRFAFTTYGTWATPQNNVREFWLPLAPSWGFFAAIIVSVLLTLILFRSRIVAATGLGVILLIFVTPMLYSRLDQPRSDTADLRESIFDMIEDEPRPYRLYDEEIENLMPPPVSP